MEAPTEVESLRIDLEIASAKASLALTILSGLVAHLTRNGAIDEKMTSLASIGYIEETAESDPAMAIAAMHLRNPDPDEPHRTTADRAEFARHWRNLLEAIRRDHRDNSRDQRSS